MTVKLPTIISANISRKLHAQGITQTEVCRRTGMCKSTLSRIINGHISHPSIWAMVRIADALGCRVDDLVQAKVTETSK